MTLCSERFVVTFFICVKSKYCDVVLLAPSRHIRTVFALDEKVFHFVGFLQLWFMTVGSKKCASACLVITGQFRVDTVSK